MPSIAVESEPGAVRPCPCRYVTLDGETFALHRAVDGRGWTISDIETGVHLAHGSTQAEAQRETLRRLRALNLGSLQRAREGALLRQWGLM